MSESGDRLTGNSKSPIGVNVSATGCLSVCVRPVTDNLSRVYHASHSGIDSTPAPLSPKKDK